MKKTRHKRNKTKSKNILIDNSINVIGDSSIVCWGYDLGNGVKGEFVTNNNVDTDNKQ